MRTKCGSTLAICKRYVKIETVIKAFHQLLIVQAGSSIENIQEMLTAIESFLLQDIINWLQGMQNMTLILSKSKSPTIQDIDVLTALIISLVMKSKKSQSPIFSLVSTLRAEILNWRFMLFNQFPIAGLVLQVSTFLTPELKRDPQKGIWIWKIYICFQHIMP